MPIAMTIHHGFIDGHHLSLFYKKVEDFNEIVQALSTGVTEHEKLWVNVIIVYDKANLFMADNYIRKTTKSTGKKSFCL